MFTFALFGLPRVAPPVGADKATLNDLLAENGVALLMGIDTVFELVSPSAHDRLPSVVVKSVPAIAVPLTVA
jgi:hypothetical protein